MYVDVFRPLASGKLDVGVASASIALGSGSTIRIYNATTSPVFVRFGTGAQTAVADTDIGIPAGAVEMFRIYGLNAWGSGNGALTLAAICPGGSGTINWQTGEGS